MLLHLHLNSKALQDKHPSVYQDFFAQNSLVVSCPAILLWSPAYAVGRGGAVLVNKLPTRVYVGLKEGKKNQKELLFFKNFVSFFPENDEWRLVDDVLPHWNSRAGRMWSHLLQKEGFPGRLEVSILSEAPLNRGWHSLQVICSALTFAIEVWRGNFTPAEIGELTSMPTEQLINNKKFNKTLITAWRTASYTDGVLDDGYAVAACLIDSYYPLIYYHEPDPSYWDQYQDLGFDNPNSYYNLVENMSWRIIRMEEMFSLPIYPQWAFDFGIIHVGKECPIVQIYGSQYGRQNQLEDTVNFITTHFTRTVPDNFKKLPFFLEICQNKKEISGWMSIFLHYRACAVSLSLEFLKSFYYLAKFGYQTEHLRSFFRLINLCQNIQSFISPATKFTDEVLSMLVSHGNATDELGVGVKIMSQGIQGDILMVSPSASFNKVFKDVFHDLEKIVKGPVYLEYLSHCDGLEKKGIRIEQYIKNNIYSPFVSQASLTLKIIDNDNKASTQLITKEELEKVLPDFDLLGDIDNKKIYIRGRPLTSKDIHSAKISLALLGKFFKEEKQQLTAQEITTIVSSYRDRNQMESKVVRPLVVAFKQYTNKRLDLTVSGKLGSNFSVIFKPTGLKIGLIEKK